ncbi:hypothetical protein A2526_04950 [candidate division WOR-1 bacterium RIFOXYD2_FULL_36_8]|uniref:histidine kinase n=1 Tax=candidate division WOR-1 bacterium RIFOXYB2_FULL_36_35 TaxID=1802578 RepID=A0A1F4S2U3_UNCSA|nr:MAG: hypothetical protein A2230_07520 [candidate division WOR-1 bacterium RIFOXYA2_FULL_36_21]OGC14764.1 MAG: hypothetical protein A2290_08725 [candidate division WOR-1 bacterium RIFOXYB2_FULL_36_35]OGC15452.1 MAG: hypothetical protein A2282_07695 [candidate division WOR-1 bacterium RIFOXYA12_FULL_36_13]OGC38784.1 MAG: hypothetical protein A2526_04950 [candidate division WOR-1 bacterium RIFOXYD2_FULL_36_8]
MLPTIVIITIFTEIFSVGVLLFTSFAFGKKFFEQKQKKDFILSLALFSFAIYPCLIIISQMLYNLGTPLSSLIFIQRLISYNLILDAFLILLFIKFRFNPKMINIILWIFFISALTMIYRVGASSISLVYRVEGVEPMVNFSIPTLLRPVWSNTWLLLSIVSLFFSFKKKGAEKTLLLYECLGSFLVFSSVLPTIAYLATQNNYYLLISWITILSGTILLTLAEIIPSKSPLAKSPFSFFRSRILFKLVFIFVLIIVILFEITTLVTLNLSKQALQKSIFLSYNEIAKNIRDQIELLDTPDNDALQNIVENKKIGRTGIAFVIDSQGNIIAHPDKTRVFIKQNFKEIIYVKKALSGKSGSGILGEDDFGQIKAGAFLPIRKFGGALIVEEPLKDAFYEMRQLETNSLIFVIIGLTLTVITGLILAQSIESPIHKLTQGTEAISHGDLSAKIDIESSDEIGKLALAFNKMTRYLQDSQDRLILSEKLAALGTMSAGMAHEIKNPLVSLRTFSQLLLSRWEDKEFREKFAQIVPAEIERINKIAESLLKFGRPSKPEMGKVNVNIILEEILTLFESECKKNNIRLSTKFTELPEITGDPQQLSQAFVNLILNAIQAMDKNGELIVKTDIGEVVQTDYKEDSLLEKGAIKAIFVEISDTGPGIDEEHLKSLFDPFFTTKVKGTGMGLPITLRIIEEHKGSIKVKSTVGKGTTFIIMLPQKFGEN